MGRQTEEAGSRGQWHAKAACRSVRWRLSVLCIQIPLACLRQRHVRTVLLLATGVATATAAHTSKASAHKQLTNSTADPGKVSAGRLTIAGCKLWQCKFVE